MTLTVELSQGTEAQLQAEADRSGRAVEEYASEAFQLWLRLVALKDDSDEAMPEDLRAISLPTLQEYWINDQDAIYDTL